MLYLVFLLLHCFVGWFVVFRLLLLVLFGGCLFCGVGILVVVGWVCCLWFEILWLLVVLWLLWWVWWVGDVLDGLL